jgi:hypothetical protein
VASVKEIVSVYVAKGRRHGGRDGDASGADAAVIPERRMAPAGSPATMAGAPPFPQVVGDEGCIRGRRWADVADEVDEEMAALAALEALCSPPSRPTLADFVAVARRAPRPRIGGRGGRGSASPAGCSSPARSLPPVVVAAPVAKVGSFLGRLAEADRRSVGVGVARADGPSAGLPPAPVAARPPSPPRVRSSSVPSPGCPNGPALSGPALVGPRPTDPALPVLPWRS